MCRRRWWWWRRQRQRHPCINHQLVVTSVIACSWSLCFTCDRITQHNLTFSEISYFFLCRSHPQSLKPLASSSASLRSRDERPSTTTAYNVLSIVHLLSARAIQHQRDSRETRAATSRDLARKRHVTRRHVTRERPERSRFKPSVRPFRAGRSSIIGISDEGKSSLPLRLVARRLEVDLRQAGIKNLRGAEKRSPSQRSDPQGSFTRNDADAGVI
ncbi:hypothetical protein ALC57_12689 [Trachymyrmex cornetzi]|uniref:Uncharacterized protein n=1 Tax=Trachymyrmex cornetzi TaxID=471704 RepID=A0A195DQQ8_9HYME|nr:hypothetical protein ALC57_12689 [Trachymyrmex cornetzi]